MKIVSAIMRASYRGDGAERLAKVRILWEALINGGLLPPNTPEPNTEYASFEVLINSDALVDFMLNPNVTVDLASGTFIPRFIEDLVLEANERHDRFAVGPGSVFNERVEVYTPGNMLSIINDTMLATDMCTDALQEQLDQGWRIIAVCPQPDQRRPDYILGRYDPDADHTERSGAKRAPYHIGERDHGGLPPLAPA